MKTAVLKIMLVAALAMGADGSVNLVMAKPGDQAGVAGAVRGSVQRAAAVAAPAKPKIGKAIKSGDAIYLGDVIRTGPKAGLQIMLMDQTVFTIGPNARMVIDDFVYNPANGRGKLDARVLKGAFRFVSGKIGAANPQAVKIKTPVATVGIRGTTIVGLVGPNSLQIALIGQGPSNNVGQPGSYMIVRAGGKAVTIFRTGFWVVVQGAGTTPGAPSPMPANWYKQVMQDLMGAGFFALRSGQTPGATVVFLRNTDQPLIEGLLPAEIERLLIRLRQGRDRIINRHQTDPDIPAPPIYIGSE